MFQNSEDKFSRRWQVLYLRYIFGRPLRGGKNDHSWFTTQYSENFTIVKFIALSYGSMKQKRSIAAKSALE